MQNRNKNVVLMLTYMLAILAGCARDPARARAQYLTKGNAYLAAGRYEEARIEFRRAVQFDSRSAEAQYDVGLACLRLGRWSDAYRAFDQATALDPTHLKARIELGELEFSSHNFEDAKQQAAAVLNADKDNVNAYLLRGRISVEQKRYADANQDFLRAQQLAPRDAKVLNDLAGSLRLLRDSEGASKTYEKAIEFDPSYYASYLNLASLYQAESKPDRQVNILRDAIVHNPQVVAPYLQLAAFYLENGNIEQVDHAFAELRANTANSEEAVLAIGTFYLERDDPERAVPVLKELLARNGKSMDAKKRLIAADLELQQVNEAQKLDEDILKDLPYDPEARLYKGRILLLKNKGAEAVNLLQPLVRDVPEMAIAHFALGLAYAQQGEIERAIGSFKESLARNPGLIPAYVALSQVYVDRGEGEIALSYATEALKRNHNLLSARLLRTNAELLQGDLQSAEKELSVLIAAYPNNAVIQERLGYVRLKQRRFPEALDRFEEALRLQPDFVPAVRDLFEVYRVQNRLDQAITRVQQQIQRAPQQAYFYELLGNIYQAQGDPASAENAYRAALARNNTYAPMVYARLAQVYEAQHRFSEAIANAKTSISQNPSLLQAYVIEGSAYRGVGQWDEARRAYQDALARDPHFAPALNSLAWLYCEHGGNLDEALSLAQHAKQLKPDDPNISDTLGWINYRKGLYRTALPLVSDAATRFPSEGLFQYHLGMALLKSGQSTQADRALRKALELQLASADAKEARRALGEKE